ncbi:oligosaccharide flippase family protein [Arthrobacter sp. G.S.26]|uniref:oligosaccharide flippase family protein n=1 Tax=Arthrobacter sp. G.S.26 TaxID=3433706 RepID=UPI003D7886EC
MTAPVQGPGTASPVTAKAPGASAALAWSLLNTGVAKLGTLGIGILLARILGPDSYGTFAVAMVALLAVLTFNELGVSLAIVRWPGDPADIAPTVTTISILSSCLFCLAGLWAAPWFAAAMGDPDAAGVVRLMVCCVPISGVVATPAALLQRSFDQKTKMAIDQVNVWLGAVISIVLALAGFGAMSLAIGRLAGTVVSGIMFVVKSPLPLRAGLDRKLLKPLLGFGLPLAGTSIIVFCLGYFDQLVIGNLLGPTMLGLYVLAFNLASWPVSVLSQPLRSVAPAALARLQHDPPRMRATVTALTGVLTAVTFPAVTLLAIQAGPIVQFVYGDAWAGAAAALTWLAMLAGLRIFFELIYDYLVVVGLTGSILTIQVCWLVALVPALLLGAADGIAGIARAQFLVAAAVVLPIYLWRLRTAGIGPARMLRQGWLPALCSALLSGFAILVERAGLQPPFAQLISAAAAIAMMAGLLWIKRADISMLKAMGRSGGLDDD